MDKTLLVTDPQFLSIESSSPWEPHEMMHLQGARFQAGVQYLMLLLWLTPHIFALALGPAYSMVVYLPNAQLRKAEELTCPKQPLTPGGDGACGSVLPIFKHVILGSTSDTSQES